MFSFFYPFSLLLDCAFCRLFGTSFLQFVDGLYVVTGCLMFLLCFFFFVFFFFIFSFKPDNKPRPKLGARTILNWKKMRPNYQRDPLRGFAGLAFCHIYNRRLCRINSRGSRRSDLQRREALPWAMSQILLQIML